MDWQAKNTNVKLNTLKEHFLGPHSLKLKVWDVQQVILSETDEGPKYLKDIVCEALLK